MRQTLPKSGWSYSWSFSAFGAALGVLVPLFLLGIQAAVIQATGGLIEPLVDQSGPTYVYLSIGLVFLGAAFGFRLGTEYDRLRSLSTMDTLTGLFTRRYFNQRLETEVSRGARHRSPLAILSVDVDHLKAINDELGHRAGDEALRRVAQVLRRDRRKSDVPARLGGDEFALLLPETTATEALAVVDRITETLSAAPEPLSGKLSVSIGLTQLDARNPLSVDDLLEAADRALYEAKAAGGGRAVLANHTGRPVSVPPVARPTAEVNSVAGEEVGWRD